MSLFKNLPFHQEKSVNSVHGLEISVRDFTCLVENPGPAFASRIGIPRVLVIIEAHTGPFPALEIEIRRQPVRKTEIEFDRLAFHFMQAINSHEKVYAFIWQHLKLVRGHADDIGAIEFLLNLLERRERAEFKNLSFAEDIRKIRLSNIKCRGDVRDDISQFRIKAEKTIGRSARP